MNSERWQAVQTLFHEAAAHPPELQSKFLVERCLDDPALVAEVLALLTEDASANSPLDRNVANFAQALFHPSEACGVPRNFGPYRIRELLGQGGMGTVWLAERSDLDTLVAIKFLRDAWMSPARRRRFGSEQRILARLDHPSIARIYDASTLPDGTPWFAMEYVDGLPLTDYCAKHHCSLRERLRLFRAVCEAVQYAHLRAVIHRDLKPSNVLVKADGSIRLMDFGIAKQLDNQDTPATMTQTGLSFMTPAYAAPEQLRGEQIGVFTDIYALGVILYELLTGNLPYDFSNRTPAQADSMILLQEPVRPSLVVKRCSSSAVAASPASWTDLDVLCLTAMRKDVERRYRSAEALIRDIDHFVQREPLDARPDSRVYRVSKFVQRNRTSLALAALILIAIGSGGLYFAWRLTQARNVALASEARTQKVQQFTLNLFNAGDSEAGPNQTLRVIDLLDRGVREAEVYNHDPNLQAELYRTLGGIYGRLGNLQRADSLLVAAVERQKSSGAETTGGVNNLVALGLVRLQESKLPEGEHLIREALRAAKSSSPRNDAAVATATLALGKALEARGAYQDARSILEDAVRLSSKSPKPTAELAAGLHELAGVHYYLGNYDFSDSLNQRALKIYREIFGDRHPAIADVFIDLGSSESQRGRHRESEEFYRKALEINRAWYGEYHPETAFAMMSTAQETRALKHYAEAKDLLVNALRIQTQVYGPAHPRVALVWNSLGNLASDLNNFDEAESDFRNSIEIERLARGDGDYRVAIGLGNLGSIYMKRKDYRRAETVFRDEVARLTRALSANHLDTGIAEARLGRSLLLQWRYADAETHCLAAHRILNGKVISSNEYLSAARADLIQIYEATRQTEKIKQMTH